MELPTLDENVQSNSTNILLQSGTKHKYFAKSNTILPIANGISYLKQLNIHRFHFQTFQLRLSEKYERELRQKNFENKCETKERLFLKMILDKIPKESLTEAYIPFFENEARKRGTMMIVLKEMIRNKRLKLLSVDFLHCHGVSFSVVWSFLKTTIKCNWIMTLQFRYKISFGQNEMRIFKEILMIMKKLKSSFSKINFKINKEENYIEYKAQKEGSLKKSIHFTCQGLEKDRKALEKLVEQLQTLAVLLSPMEFTTLIFNFKRSASVSDEQLGYFKDVLMSNPMTKNLEINLNWCYEISNLGLFTMLEGLKIMENLTSVKMSIGGCFEITDGVIRVTSDTLKRFVNLETLSLDFSDVNHLSNLSSLGDCFSMLENLQNIYLKFSWCTKIDDKALKQLTESLGQNSKNVQKITLNFEHCDQISNKGIEQLMRSLGKNIACLQHLYLKLGWCKKITDEGLKEISFVIRNYLNHITRLKLDLKGCEAITDKGIEFLAQDFPQILPNMKLLSLNFKECKKITNKALEQLGMSLCLQELDLLENLSLDFGWCKQLSDSGISQLGFQISNQMPNLKSLKLNFGGCNAITDEGLTQIASVIRKSLNNLLKLSLNFGWCKGVSDKGVQELGDELGFHCQSLKELSLNFNECKEITDFGLEHLGLRISQNLFNLTHLTLNFNWCNQISDEATISLEKKLDYISNFKFIVCE